MIHITVTDLRNMIFFKINETIREYRQSKKEVHSSENFPMVTEDEIDDFVRMNPYYDAELKDFLLCKLKVCAMYVSESWFGWFYSGITSWYDSVEWMDYAPEMIPKALANYEDGSYSKLRMPDNYLGESFTLDDCEVRIYGTES